MALVKKADDARVREMLRLLNFFAAPFGSIESHLLRYGVEGVDFNYDERGNPQHTELGRAEILPWGSLTSSTGTGGGGEVWYSPQESQSVQRYQGYEKLLAPLGVEDASIGTFSPTFAARGSIMLEDVGGGAQDIIAGRRPLSEWDGIVNAWRNWRRPTSKGRAGEELRAAHARLKSGSGESWAGRRLPDPDRIRRERKSCRSKRELLPLTWLPGASRRRSCLCRPSRG